MKLTFLMIFVALLTLVPIIVVGTRYHDAKVMVTDAVNGGMSSMYMLICISLILAVGVLLLLVWAFRKGQFDDTEGPKHRIDE